MKRRLAVVVAAMLILALASLLGAFQVRSSQRWEWEMQEPINDPPDASEKGEFTFARLRYRSFSFGGGGGRGFGGRGFGRGGRSSWGIDANRADRLIAQAVRRLTRISARSVEEVIDIDEGPLFDYPWLYAVEVGRWELSTAHAKKLREYLDRGGFLMVDDFHGSQEWAIFMDSLQRVFPDRQVMDIPGDDAIFKVISSLADRFQVPGAQFLRSGVTYERDGYEARWAGIFDDKGRIQVAICHNMDLGDAWQYADDPMYPEKFAGLAIRVAINDIGYAMTH